MARRLPRPDRQPCPPGRGRLDAAAEPDRLDRQQPAWRRHHHDLRRRGSHARPAQGHRRPQGHGDLPPARLLRGPAIGRQALGRRAGDRAGHGRERLRRTRRSRRGPARGGGPRQRQGRIRGQGDGRLGAQIRHPEHYPHRRPQRSRFRLHRRRHRAGGRRRHHRPHQRRPHRVAAAPDPLPVRRLPARHRDRA